MPISHTVLVFKTYYQVNLNFHLNVNIKGNFDLFNLSITSLFKARHHSLRVAHSRRDLFRVFDIGFGQIEGILGIILAKEVFKKNN